MQLLKHRSYWMVGGVIVCLAVMAHGQTRADSLIVKGSVSETVALSVPANFQPDNFQIALNDQKALTLTMSGSGPEVRAVRIPILIRSNTGYLIFAQVRSQALPVVNLAVVEAHPTGRFVAPDAIANLKVMREYDSLRTNGTNPAASFPLSVSAPLAILSGPRVSLSGTLNSVDNAVEVTLLISVKPDPGTDSWLLRLTLSASAGNHF